jgi:hypothetical protein
MVTRRTAQVVQWLRCPAADAVLCTAAEALLVGAPSLKQSSLQAEVLHSRN